MKRIWSTLIPTGMLVCASLGCAEGESGRPSTDSDADSDSDSDSDADSGTDTDADSGTDTDTDSDTDSDGGPDGGEDTDTATDCASAGGECEYSSFCYGPEIEEFSDECDTTFDEICCGPTDCPWECYLLCGYGETEHPEYDCGSHLCCEPA